MFSRRHAILFLSIFSMLLFVGRAEAGERIRTIDLSESDFWHDGPYSLDRRWDFYANNFVNPDSVGPVEVAVGVPLTTLWNDIQGFGSQWSAMGYASYQVRIYVPENRPQLGLKIPDMYSSYRLYANGELISQNGVPEQRKLQQNPNGFHGL